MTAKTNYLEEDYVRTFIDDEYRKNGKRVKLVFEKRDGTERKMVIEQNEKLLSQIQGIRQHANAHTKVVTERLGNGQYQFRSIPLDRVFEIALV